MDYGLSAMDNEPVSLPMNYQPSAMNLYLLLPGFTINYEPSTMNLYLLLAGFPMDYRLWTMNQFPCL